MNRHFKRIGALITVSLASAGTHADEADDNTGTKSAPLDNPTSAANLNENVSVLIAQHRSHSSHSSHSSHRSSSGSSRPVAPTGAPAWCSRVGAFWLSSRTEEAGVEKAIDYESLDKGSPLDGLSIPALTRVTLARFAGASDDYNPMHLDDKVATAAGKNSVFAPGNLVMAYVGRMVQGYFAGASLRRLSGGISHSITISASAGTSRGMVLHLTSCTGR